MSQSCIIRLISLATLTLLAWVDSAPAAPREGPSCRAVRQACLSAGFGGRKGGVAGVYAQCLRPIILGQPVTGVAVKPEDVNACRARFEAKHAGSGGKGGK
jgi:hypothetical protein